jgi:hypothetical protein
MAWVTALHAPFLTVHYASALLSVFSVTLVTLSMIIKRVNWLFVLIMKQKGYKLVMMAIRLMAMDVAQLV